MTALAKNYNRPTKAHQQRLVTVAVNAGSKIYVGALVVREAATGVSVPASDAAGVMVQGIAQRHPYPSDPDLAIHAAFDNSNGADGTIVGDKAERCINVDTDGEYLFAVSAGTPKFGDPAFVVDDNTVSASATTNNVVAGEFTRPGEGGWWVNIGRRNLTF